MKKRKAKVREPPEQTEWRNLVRLEAMQDFARWLSEPQQGWEMDALKEGELLRAHRYGRRIVVVWDKRRGATVCPRAVMVLWYAFVFDVSLNLNNDNFETCNKNLETCNK